jgi:hypothetical protein
MAKLSEEMIQRIQEAAEKILYGEITIHLVESLNAVDIEVNERMRFMKEGPPRLGEVAVKKPFRVMRQDG